MSTLVVSMFSMTIHPLATTTTDACDPMLCAYAACAPIASCISRSRLARSAMPVKRCTAMAIESTRCVPIASASRHVQCVLAEWCISRTSCYAVSLSPPILSTANGSMTVTNAKAAVENVGGGARLES